MASFRVTARKSTVPRRTPESIIREYEMHARSCGEDLGKFLAQSRVFWYRANRHGVSHYEGIIRLIGLLPEEWKTWAIRISQNYINDAVNGFPRFMGEIHFCFIVNRKVPQGTYLMPGGQASPGGTATSRQPRTPPEGATLPTPRGTLGRRTRDEAGPSHVSADDTLRAAEVVTPAKSPPEEKPDQHFGIARKRYRKDKAPIQEGRNAQDRFSMALKGDALDAWIMRRFDGPLRGQFLLGDHPQMAIYLDSSSEEDPEEDLDHSSETSGDNTTTE